MCGRGGWAVVGVALVGENGWGSCGAVRSMVGGVCVTFARHVQLSWVVCGIGSGGGLVYVWCSVGAVCHVCVVGVLSFWVE